MNYEIIDTSAPTFPEIILNRRKTSYLDETTSYDDFLYYGNLERSLHFP